MITAEFLRRDYRIRLLALFGILVLINVLLDGVVIRSDLTRGKVYSLSESSKGVLSRLEQPVHVKGYFTRDLQAPYNGYEQEVKDKLDQYVAYSNGRLRYEFKDPTGSTELEEEARRFGITPAKIDYRDRDQRQIKTAFMGVAFVSGTKQEVIPIVRNLGGLEYEITRILKKVSTDAKKKNIAFLLGHSEPDILKQPPPQQGGQNPLRQAIEESHAVVTADMSQKVEIPDTADALLVFAPMQELPPRHQFEIDQFIMSGKPVGFFLPSHMVDMRQGRLQPLTTGLEPLLEHYGVKLTHRLILDRRQNGRTQFPVRQGRLTFQALINYPLHPVATRFDKASIIVRDTEAMVMPVSQILALNESASNNPAVTARELITSAESSSARKGEEMPAVDPQALMDEEAASGEDPGPFPMAYTLEGVFKSYWSDRALPNEDGSLDGLTVVPESPKNRLLVVGGAEFLRQSPEVFLNMVDWLAQDEDLISIRSRGETAGPLKTMEPATRRAISIANAAGLPLLFVLLGFVRWRLRKRTLSAMGRD